MAIKYEHLHIRLKQLREELNLTQEQFSEGVGSSSLTTIYNWETGITQPYNKTLEKIESEFAVNPRWLRYGEGEIFLREEQQEGKGRQEEIDSGRISKSKLGRARKILADRGGEEAKGVEVKVHDHAGLGNAFFIQEQMPSYKPLEIKTFPAELVGGYRDAFQLRGHSMYPTLDDGDYVGVDFNDVDFVDNELYLIYRTYEGFSVKRLEDHPDGILIKSDSPMTEDKILGRDIIEHELKIIGRIAWIFGKRK